MIGREPVHSLWCGRRRRKHLKACLIKRSLPLKTDAFISKLSSVSFVYDHTTGNVPVLVRSPKSSPVGRGEYLAGRPLGNTPCCRLFGHLFWSNFTFPRQPVVLVFFVVVVQLCNAERELKMAATDVCF